MRDTERERQRQRHRQREKQAPCREPDVGLNPGSPGSCPGLKTALNCWVTRAAQWWFFILFFIYYYYFLKILFLYSWETQRERGRGRDTDRGRSRLHAGSLSRDSIPGLQNCTLGQRQALNCWATQGSRKELLISILWTNNWNNCELANPLLYIFWQAFILVPQETGNYTHNHINYSFYHQLLFRDTICQASC